MTGSRPDLLGPRSGSGTQRGIDGGNIADVDFLRFLAIFFVMALHVPDSGSFVTPEVGFDFAFATTVLQTGLGRISAPLIGLVSGYYAIALLEHRGVRGFLGKKVTTLLRPLLFWNLACILLLVALNLASGGQHYGFIHAATLPEYFGLTAIPVNVPLHYLADLLKACLLLAGLWWLAARLRLARRTTAVLLIAMGALLYLVIATAGVTGWTPFQVGEDAPLRLLFRPDLAIFFFVGAGLALLGASLPALVGRAGRIPPAVIAALFAGLTGLAVVSLGDVDPLALAGIDLAKRCIGAVFLFALVARLGASGLTLAVPRRVTFRAFCSHPLVYLVLVPVLGKLGFAADASPSAALLAALLLPGAAVGLAWLSIAAQDQLAEGLPFRPARRMVAAIP